MPALPRRRKAPAPVPVHEAQRQLCQYGGIDWWHIERPDAASLLWMSETFDFHELNLDDVISRHQRPKVDRHEDHLFIVLHLPVWNRELQRLETGEVDIFVTPTAVITLSSVKINALDRLFSSTVNETSLRADLMGQGTGRLLYRIVDRLFERCFPMLRKIQAKLSVFEENVFDNTDKHFLRNLTSLKTEISVFRRAVRPQRVVIRDLERAKTLLSQDPDIDYYFDDVDDTAARIWDLLEGYLETINTLMEAYEAVTNQRVNEVLRMLTAISVIVLPLTLLASIWGMNVHVPGENLHAAFWIIISGMLLLLCGMLLWFKRKGWL